MTLAQGPAGSRRSEAAARTRTRKGGSVSLAGVGTLVPATRFTLPPVYDLTMHSRASQHIHSHTRIHVPMATHSHNYSRLQEIPEATSLAAKDGIQPRERRIYCRGIHKRSFALLAQAGVQLHYLGSLQPPRSRVQGILLPQPPESSWDYRHASLHLENFIFLVDMGFHHVGQVGLELLTSGDHPASASESAGIAGGRSRLRLKNKEYRPRFCLLSFVPMNLTSLTLSPCEYSGTISAHCNLCLLCSSNSPASVSQVAGLQ
ncbi:Protein GVQW1, partial [Plecturocebus cupreus]